MAAIQFDRVSKQFALQQERPRSFQEVFLNLVRFKRSPTKERYWALRDVNLAVEPGETVGIIGANGAGKSTMLKLISRIIEPTMGSVVVTGRLGALLELGAGFHPDLTGRENIYLNASILGMNRTEIRRKLDAMIAFAELERFIDVPVRHYSSGMYVRLGFSVAVHTEPEILLVDEVLAVGDEAFQHKCMDHIAALRRAGVTIVLVSHDLETIQSLCRRAVWLEEGEVKADGHPVDVVMTYLDQVAWREETKALATPVSDPPEDSRWGTGQIRITRVELCDEAGTRRSTFTTGDPLEIRLCYQADRRVDDPVFGLAIHSQSGVHVCGPNTAFGNLTIPFVEGEGKIIYRIPSLPLMQGAYAVSVSAHSRSDTETYDYHDRAYPFRVYPGRSCEQYGLVTLEGKWHIDSPVAYETTAA